MPDARDAIGSGPNFQRLAQAVSDALHAALERGMATDEAVCCAAAVIADYARREYGNGYLPRLAEIVVARAGEPLPFQQR